ncbi:MAG: dTDP-glucose 4,6-dehydratase [Nitrospinaceae bacterium]
MKTVLITGGAGFIGSNFIRRLYRKYPDVRILVLDALTYAGSVHNLPSGSCDDQRFEFWYGNVRNGELVDTLVARSDVVIHFAAETHVTRSIYDNRLFFETDVLGTQVVANAVLKHQKSVERFIHISTSEVYGTAQNPRMSEADPLNPMSPYAAAKAGADRLVYSYFTTYGIPAIILRPFNNYGPRQHLEKAVPRFVTSCLLGEALKVHGDGSAARDYIFVDDVCQAIELAMLASLDKVRGEVFNIASGRHRSILSIARNVVGMMGLDDSAITFIGDRPGQVFRHTGDSGKIQRVLGWKPEVTWEDGLARTIDWYRVNKSWWENQLWMRAVPITAKNGARELH